MTTKSKTRHWTVKPLVAIVGRPNVGKSTLANRIAGERLAIVEDVPGVTRDRIYLDAEWNGRPFMAIDTGGIIPDRTDDQMMVAVRAQAELAMDEADAIIFLVDGTEPANPVDLALAKQMRKAKRAVRLVVNKMDNPQRDYEATEFYKLGLGEPFPISATHGHGVADLLDEIVAAFPPIDEGEESDETLRLAIVGRPNVGKSSIVNAILGEERVVVSDVAGTTRDAIDAHTTHEGKPYVLVDTAGIRRKAKVEYGVESFAVIRALKAIERADVVVVVLDASAGVTEQDQRIAGLAVDAGKPIVVVVNKWDLIPDKGPNTLKQQEASLRESLYFMTWAPLLFISAHTRKRLFDVFAMARDAAEQHSRRVGTGVVNEVVREAVSLNPPPTDKGKGPRINYATQATTAPPTFVFFSTHPDLIRDTYKRYLEGKLREAFGFQGTPIRMFFREKREKG